MKCPVCGTIYRPGRGAGEQIKDSTLPTCRRCKADLSDLFRVHDQAIWYHKQAIDLLAQKRYLEAAAHNKRAIALYVSNANFHALAGKLSALQGEFPEAIASWQQALKFDSQNTVASNCLEMIQVMAKNYST
jgi:tetratricopeptide (TPR) repeat protein